MKLYNITRSLQLEVLEVAKETQRQYLCLDAKGNRHIAKVDRNCGEPNPDIFLDPANALAELRIRVAEATVSIRRSYAEAAKALGEEADSTSQQHAPARPIYPLLKTVAYLVEGAVRGGLGTREALNFLHRGDANLLRHLAALDDSALEEIRQKVEATVLQSPA